MVDAISTKTAPSVKAPIVDSSANGAASAQSSTGAQSDAKTGKALNPRLVYDKLAGVVVTEFLNGSGVVQLQTPSSAVLAYLRVGLSAEGHSKYQPKPEKPNQNPDTTYDS